MTNPAPTGRALTLTARLTTARLDARRGVVRLHREVLAALGLAASLVPTTLGGHAFWTHDDPAQRTNQRNHFNKNLGLLGGLLVVALGRGKGST